MRRGKSLTLIGIVWITWSLSIGNSTVSARSARVVPRAVLDSIPDDAPPVSRRAAKTPFPPTIQHNFRLPEAHYRTPAEYEPGAGVLVRWGSFNDILTQVIVGITTGGLLGRAHVVVGSRIQQERAAVYLDAAGADMDRVSFILFHTASPWMRDYGPRFLTDQLGAARAILTHNFSRANRSAGHFPAFLSRLWGENMVSFPLAHAGGNFHVFSDGDAFATERIALDNPAVKRWQLIAWFLSATNLDLTVFPAFPENFDSSGHIDMWMLPVADKEVLVGQYPPRSGLPHQITEKATQDLENRGYKVFRTPGWRSRGHHFTYTNALIFNDLVFVPVFDRYPEKNLEALKVYAEAFPNRQLIPVPL